MGRLLFAIREGPGKSLQSPAPAASPSEPLISQQAPSAVLPALTGRRKECFALSSYLARAGSSDKKLLSLLPIEFFKQMLVYIFAESTTVNQSLEQGEMQEGECKGQ